MSFVKIAIAYRIIQTTQESRSKRKARRKAHSPWIAGAEFTVEAGTRDGLEEIGRRHVADGVSFVVFVEDVVDPDAEVQALPWSVFVG